MSIVNTPVNTTTTIVTLPAGSTRTGLDQIISLITNDPGLLKKVSATDLASGAAAADAMNGLIVQAIRATGIANNGDITAGDVRDLNAWLRVRNTGVAPASAGNLFVSEVEVDQLDILHGLRLDDQLSGAAQAILYSPTAFTQSAAFANSAAPASAVLSNTAAGYATLGGLWQFAAVATAATDFCLFGFAVPAPYRLKLTGVTITCYNTGAANAATPATTMLWGLGVNGASANLATGAHIRRALGTTSIPISAAIGAEGSALHIDFETPIYCEPGTTLAVIMRVVAGAATASQIIAGTCNFAGAFE